MYIFPSGAITGAVSKSTAESPMSPWIAHIYRVQYSEFPIASVSRVSHHRKAAIKDPVSPQCRARDRSADWSVRRDAGPLTASDLGCAGTVVLYDAEINSWGQTSVVF